MNMTRRIVVGFISVSFSIVWSGTLLAADRGPSEAVLFKPPALSSVAPEKNRALGLTLSIKPTAKVEDINAILPAIITEIARGAPRDLPSIREAMGILSRQPYAHAAFQSYYRALPPANYRERLFALALIGELRAHESFPLLREVVWSPLPGTPTVSDQQDGMSERRSEETVRIKAIHGIGYLRTEEAFEELKRIMREHESKILRASAIDTYLWNRGDAPEAIAELTKLLPKEFHPYIGVVRFHKGVTAQEFSRKLREKRSGRQDPRREEGIHEDTK